MPYPTKIINFSSRISFTGGKNLSHYAPMKAAINLITLILSKEHDGKKVTFNTICPGKIIKNYQHKRRRNKKMRKYITSEILSKKIFYIYFSKNKKSNGKLFLLDKHQKNNSMKKKIKVTVLGASGFIELNLTSSLTKHRKKIIFKLAKQIHY